MNPNLAPRAGTLRELKRQSNYLKTIMTRADEKHEAVQAERRVKAARIDEQIAFATELEEMEVN